MSWPEQQITQGATEKRCKIRKRRCSSSSSSSTLVRKYRFKRAIVVAKRVGGPSTPVPSWKMSAKSHSSKISTTEFPNRSPSCSLDGVKGKEASVSARKLAATLWEINEVPNSQKMKNSLDVVEDKKELKSREMFPQISRSGLSDPDPTFITVSEKVEGGRVHRRRRSTSSFRIEQLGGSDFHGNDCLIEIENPSHGKAHRKTKFMLKTRLKEVSNCLTTSKELLKVLNHVWSHEDHDDQEQPSSTFSLITALKAELDRAKTRVDHLIKEQSFNGDEIELLMKRFAEEKAAWKYKERARIRSAIASMADEVEVEKKLRRQAERLNKRIAKELADAKVSLSKAMKDLQREKRAKEIFEQICDELAKGIGEDRAQFEELKKESEKVREEVEKEREMLQLADVLREERVQMKLSEAKYHFEEKNAAVERLKDELEAYLITQLGNENGEDSCNKFEKIKELEAYLKKINFGSSQNIEKDEEGENEAADDSDDESDLHSIELNMDNNNKSYRWSFVHGSQNGSKRNSFEKESNGRKSLSEKIQWGSICLNRKASNSKNGELGRKSHENSDRFDWERFSELLTQSQTQTHKQDNEADEDETQKQKSVKCLRDLLFSGSPHEETPENEVCNKRSDDPMPVQNDEASMAIQLQPDVKINYI